MTAKTLKKQVAAARPAKHVRPAGRLSKVDRLEDYADPKATKRSIDRALNDLRDGKISVAFS